MYHLHFRGYVQLGRLSSCSTKLKNRRRPWTERPMTSHVSEFYHLQVMEQTSLKVWVWK